MLTPLTRASLVIGGILIGGFLAPTTAIGADKPNIIHIMVDDAGVGDFTSYWRSSPIHTPNIDALAAEGMKFTNAYAGAPQCAPSRSVLMTGLHGGHTYLRSNNGAVSIRDQDVTIAEVLGAAGYATGGYGKWGLGTPGTPGAPELQGFDEFVGYYDQVHAHAHYPDRIYDSGNTLLIPENGGFNEPETGLVSNNRVHAHQVIFDRMKQFVTTNVRRDQAFYAWGAWTPPHRRSTLPQSEAEPGGLVDRYEGRAGWDRFDQIQAGFVSWIDQQVGELRTTLADPNGDGDTSDSVLGNTLIVFTSDNGGWQSSHNWDRNRETVNGVEVNLRGAKEGPYEGGLRTPMIAFWEGRIAAGSESDLITTFADFLPTFAELADSGQTPEGIDGLSIAPTLTGAGTQQIHEGVYFEDYSYNDNRADPEQAVRSGDWKLIRKHGGALELFNLKNDPGETFNLIRTDRPASTAAHAATRDELLAFMARNQTPLTMQFSVNPPNVGTGRTQRDGVQSFGIRADAEGGRRWIITENGPAHSIESQLVDINGDAVLLHIDDLHQDYKAEMNIEKIGEVNSTSLVELLGASGFVYFTGEYDTTVLDADTTQEISLDLLITESSPTVTQAANDLGDNLMLRITQKSMGATGQPNILVSEVKLTAVPEPSSLFALQLGLLLFLLGGRRNLSLANVNKTCRQARATVKLCD